MTLNYKYIISDDMFARCEQFAKDSVSTSADKYARRNQFDVEKIKKDIRNGKLGEQGTHNVLLEHFPNLSEPDYKIYSKKDKSWDPDLSDPSGLRVAVKSQDIDSAINYGESWVFQHRPNKTYDCDLGIFKENNDNHYVAFNSLNVPKRIGFIKAIVKVSWLHEKSLFKEMKIPHLRGNKVAVYFSDLELYKDELWQL